MPDGGFRWPDLLGVDPDFVAMRDDERWTTADVARHLQVGESTVRAYAARGQMPAPDGRLGRTPWWRPATIRDWRPS